MRRHQVSDVVIDGTLTIDRTDNRIANEIFVVDHISIGPNGKIVLNGNAVSIFANTLDTQNNASILSYADSDRKRPPAPPQLQRGANGNAPAASGGVGPGGIAGASGGDGGSLTVFVSTFEGPLLIDLQGQDGGDGSKGGQGGDGARRARQSQA